MNCSPLSLTSLEKSRSRTFNSSLTIAQSTFCPPAEWSAQAIELVPKEVLKKKAKIVKGLGMLKTEENHGSKNIANMVN